MILEPIRTIEDDYVPPDNRTLGMWAYLWCSQYLLQPDGPDAGKPWRFTPEQIRIIKRWYEIDENGRFVYRQGTIRRLKGWGKLRTPSPLRCVRLSLSARAGSRIGGRTDSLSLSHSPPHGSRLPLRPWTRRETR